MRIYWRASRRLSRWVSWLRQGIEGEEEQWDLCMLRLRCFGDIHMDICSCALFGVSGPIRTAFFQCSLHTVASGHFYSTNLSILPGFLKLSRASIAHRVENSNSLTRDVWFSAGELAQVYFPSLCTGHTKCLNKLGCATLFHVFMLLCPFLPLPRMLFLAWLSGKVFLILSRFSSDDFSPRVSFPSPISSPG